MTKREEQQIRSAVRTSILAHMERACDMWDGADECDVYARSVLGGARAILRQAWREQDARRRAAR